jgi:hypothetical protein
VNLDLDKAREQRIDRDYFALMSAKTPEQRKVVWERMRAEINQRSQEQVAKMEHAKGLR